MADTQRRHGLYVRLHEPGHERPLDYPAGVGGAALLAKVEPRPDLLAEPLPVREVYDCVGVHSLHLQRIPLARALQPLRDRGAIGAAADERDSRHGGVPDERLCKVLPAPTNKGDWKARVSE